MSFHLCCQVLSLSGGSAAEAHTHTHTDRQTVGPMHLSRLSRRQPSKQHQMMQLLRHADGKGTGKDIKQDGLGQKSRGDSLAPIFAILGGTKSKSSAANVIFPRPHGHHYPPPHRWLGVMFVLLSLLAAMLINFITTNCY